MEQTVNTRNPATPEVRWPRPDYSRVPYWLYHDRQLYEVEQERIFKGPVWNYVALEAEIPNPGDFRTCTIGETPVIVNRAQDGSIHAMVNRCAHRGALVRRETRGNANDHTCIYHKWCYSLDGGLVGVPFRRGLRGQGGMPPNFDMAEHGLQRLRVESFRGVIFASFRQELEPLADYLGPVLTRHIDRLFAKPIRILGYQRQRIMGNWKQYAENTRDTYHGSLLHEFQSTFGLSRVTQTGGVTMDARHRHNLTWSEVGTDDEAEFSALYKDNKVHDSRLRLEEPSMVKFQREFGDGTSLAICSIFPNLTLHQISNSLGARQVRTFGPGGAFEEDDAENWQECTRSSRGVVAQRYPMNLTMGLGHERRSEEFPGLESGLPSEMNQRAFYRRWLELMTATSWAEIAITPAGASQKTMPDPPRADGRERC